MHKLILLLLSFTYAGVAYGADKITANALFEGKAVLIIRGERVFLSAGETKKGVKLLEANGNGAVIEVNGQRKILGLDKSIAKQYADPAEWKRNIIAKTHVISAKLIHQTHNLATFEVDYYYDKKLGDYATMSAKTMFKGEATAYWSHTHTRLIPGRNLATVTVSMNDEAPPSYMSDEVRFDITWIKGDASGSTGTYLMEFIKEWRQ